MEERGVKIYPYRWVVLVAFMLVNIMVQVLWICYAPIASVAAAAYGVKREDIDLLANLFMLIYIPISFPAAWAIDTFGFKKAVGFGSTLMAAFALLRAAFPFSYAAALVGAIGISVGQPFLLNAFTKLAAQWFPQKQRATVIGVIFLSLFAGIGLGETLSPRPDGERRLRRDADDFRDRDGGRHFAVSRLCAGESSHARQPCRESSRARWCSTA